MPVHDIIDNRQEKLVDHINRILDSSDAARFAVGYFFLSGLTAISKKLSRIKELRLLLGNTTNRELNRIRRNGMTGEHLMRALTELYHQHSMRGWSERRNRDLKTRSYRRSYAAREWHRNLYLTFYMICARRAGRASKPA